MVTGPGHKLLASVSQGPSFGGLSILKKSSAATVSACPLSNVTKLMQAQDPDLPPNVIAQQSLPTSNPASKASKVMSRPNPAAAQAALMMAVYNQRSPVIGQKVTGASSPRWIWICDAAQKICLKLQMNSSLERGRVPGDLRPRGQPLAPAPQPRDGRGQGGGV